MHGSGRGRGRKQRAREKNSGEGGNGVFISLGFFSELWGVNRKVRNATRPHQKKKNDLFSLFLPLIFLISPSSRSNRSVYFLSLKSMKICPGRHTCYINDSKLPSWFFGPSLSLADPLTWVVWWILASDPNTQNIELSFKVQY